MIDDDDVEMFAIFGSGGNGPVGCVLFVVILIALIFIASQNKDECATRHCPDGMRPQVTHHECLCVTPAR